MPSVLKIRDEDKMDDGRYKEHGGDDEYIEYIVECEYYGALG